MYINNMAVNFIFFKKLLFLTFYEIFILWNYEKIIIYKVC